MSADVHPMPERYLRLPPRLRPMPPPIFPDGPPTAADIAEARALFAALDPESQAWYRRGGSRLFGDL